MARSGGGVRARTFVHRLVRRPRLFEALLAAERRLFEIELLQWRARVVCEYRSNIGRACEQAEQDFAQSIQKEQPQMKHKPAPCTLDSEAWLRWSNLQLGTWSFFSVYIFCVDSAHTQFSIFFLLKNEIEIEIQISNSNSINSIRIGSGKLFRISIFSIGMIE